MFIPILIFLVGATFGAPVVPMPVAGEAAIQQPVNKRPIETLVDEHFAEMPILIDIARCESQIRHFDSAGAVLRGEINSDDIGVMQINTRYHQGDADELGIDIYSLDGNLEYAKYLYEKQGVRPWKASMPCWGKIAQK